MMLHVVLFTPRPDLADDQRARLQEALVGALSSIGTIARYRVGRRVLLGTAYDAMVRDDYAYCAIVEFEDRDGLHAYLAHPAHEAIGRLFYETSERAAAYDYDAVDADPGTALARWQQDE